MRKATLLATALIFAGAQLAVAMPTSFGAGQSLTQSSDGMVTLVASDKKKGKNALISSTGCKSKKHTIGVEVGYVPNPNPPAAASAKDSFDIKCS